MVLYVCPSYRCCVDFHFTLLFYCMYEYLRSASEQSSLLLSLGLSFHRYNVSHRKQRYRPHKFVCNVRL